jgi:chaperonin GroEL
MDKAVEVITNNLQEISKPITSKDDIEHIATISANGDKSIGNLIAMAVDQAGKDGSITVEEARSLTTSLDVVEGFRFDSGFVATAFINDERRGVINYDDPLILVCDNKIDTVEEILPILEVVAREGRALIIVAEEIEGQALAALIMNTVRGTMKIAAVKAPRYGEERRSILKDLSLAVGASFVSKETRLELKDIKLEHLGTSKTIEIQKNLTTIVDGSGNFDEIEKRVEALKVELKQTDSLKECEKIQERITRLISGVAIIRVGAATEIEMIEKRHRIEDALEAVRSAQMEGIVPGGGVALIECTKDLKVDVENDDQALGIKIILEAVKEPLRQMASNAGLSPDVVVEKVKSLKENQGFNFSTGEIVDLLAAGVIDPAKVTRCALQNATSVAGTLITTNHAIID